ncbi:MAG: transcription antitermination factor NusB [Clostridiales bacterium]|nr:transcription antitermination factor NusB [Clostridiales bacterium]
MVRTKARENAFLLLFQESFSKSQDSSEILDVNSEIGEIQVDDYCKKLFNGVVSHKDEIDSVIEKHLVRWKKNRLSKVALTAIRIALYEMYYCDDIDDSVAISQAVILLKKYDDEKAASFANGVLGSCSRDRK